MTIDEYKNLPESRERKPRRDVEHQIQSALFDVLRLNERKHPELKFIAAIPNGGQRHAAVAAKLRAEGVKSGIPDIICPFSRHSKSGLFIEMKAETDLSDTQSEFSDHLRRENYVFRMCRSADAALDEIEKYLGIKLLR